METKTIDAALLAKMFLAGARNLESKKEWINELNVFPVPDGDTGTNMTLTIMSAVREVSSLETLTMDTFARAISSGSLRGARGNSGVILSQLLRGFSHGIRQEKEITPAVVASAFQKAVETAYKAVMKPKEGTILTVARGGADYACELLKEDPDITFDEMFPAIIQRSEEILAKTPEMLPVLKEAGVVDSGGQGLLEVLKGALDAYNGKEISGYSESETSALPEENVSFPDARKKPLGAAMDAEIKYGYCTEFIILPEKKFTEESERALKEYLSSIGDSLVVVADEDMVKVHVHTNDPGLALTRALTYGSLTKMKIDNMREEHEERVITEADRQKAAEEETQSPAETAKTEPAGEPCKDSGFLAVAIGEGIGEIFRDLGVDCLIEGGQTMNPSTEDMLNAIAQIHAKNIFILPNNKNIILTANQAKSLTEDKHVFVIPTETIPQGITAIINYVPEKPAEENAAEMERESKAVRTGQVTYAIRDTHYEDKVISAGDIMGVGDKDILSVGREIETVALETVAAMMHEEAELISVYYGEEIKEEEALKFCSRLREDYPQCDVEVNYGGQPIYYYIVSVE